VTEIENFQKMANRYRGAEFEVPMFLAQKNFKNTKNELFFSSKISLSILTLNFLPHNQTHTRVQTKGDEIYYKIGKFRAFFARQNPKN